MSSAPSHSVTAEEQALCARLRANEPEAFAAFVRTYSPRMLAIARRYLHDESDAHDALQDAFLSAFKSLPGFAGQSSLGTWLHTIVCRAALMKLRTQRRRKDAVLIDDLLPRYHDDGHRMNPEPRWSGGADVDALQMETRELVRKSIDQLPDDHRTVLLLRDIEGFDTETTAQILEINVNAVKTRLHRARQALRKLLQPHFQ